MQEITSLDELKKIELSIMKKVHQFCEENGIWYVLSYGTLIGAIRHSGFIPWDDDIDIFMMRDGYEKFEAMFPTWGKAHGLFLAGPNSEDHYFPRDLLKVCDVRTSLIEKVYKRTEPIGVFVDVWVLDEVPEMNWKTKNWILSSNICKEINLLADTSYEYAKENMKLSKCLAVKLLSHFKTQNIIHRQQSLSQKYRRKGGEKLICVQGNCKIFNKKDFSGRFLHQFEDTQFYVPVGYDNILRVDYGDYMQLPPLDQQKPHHIQDIWWN